MTSGAIHVAQVPESGWPCPLPPPLGCNLSTNRKRKPKWRRCVAASIAVGPSAILTGSRTRPSDWGSNARFGPVEDRRNNRRLATFTCTLCVLQIWWLHLSEQAAAEQPCHLSAAASSEQTSRRTELTRERRTRAGAASPPTRPVRDWGELVRSLPELSRIREQVAGLHPSVQQPEP